MKQINMENDHNEIIVLGHENHIVVGVYRPFKLFSGETVNGNWERIKKGLDVLDYNKKVIIMGDLNIDIERKDPLSKDLTDFLIFQYPNVTRRRVVSGVMQESSIDLAMLNFSSYKMNTEFNPLSDHCLLKIETSEFNSVLREKRTVTVTDWRFDLEKANEFLWGIMQAMPSMSSMNVLELDYGIRACLMLTYRKFVRKRTITVRNSNEVVSPNIIRLRNIKSKLTKKWLKDKSALNWTNMIISGRNLRAEVRKVRKSILMNKMTKGSKEFWGEVNNLMGKRSKGIEMIEVAGKLFHKPDEMAEG